MSSRTPGPDPADRSDRSDIPEVTLVFEDEATRAPRTPRDGGRTRTRARVMREGSRGGRYVETGAVTPGVLGVALAVVSVIGIFAVNLAGLLPLPGVTTATALFTSTALATTASIAGQLFGLVGAASVTAGVAVALAAVGRRTGRLRAAPFVVAMLSGWMLTGLVQSVTSGPTTFIVQALAFAAALGTALVVVSPGRWRALASAVGGAGVLVVGASVVLTGAATLVSAVGSVIAASAAVLLGAWAWNRWFAPALEARDQVRRAMMSGVRDPGGNWRA